MIFTDHKSCPLAVHFSLKLNSSMMFYIRCMHNNTDLPTSHSQKSGDTLHDISSFPQNKISLLTQKKHLFLIKIYFNNKIVIELLMN